MSKKNTPKVIIFGIDGGDYQITKKLIEQGKLPNLGKLAGNGLFSCLQSTIPPMTSPAWPTMYTGTNPGKHGIFDFIRIHPQTGELSLCNTLQLKTPPFWELLGQAGLRSLIMNVPVTYPPPFTKGILISGYPTPKDKHKITYPENLFTKELENKLGRYITDPTLGGKSGKEEESFLELKQIQARQKKYLFHLAKNTNWDCIFYVTSITDYANHFFAGKRPDLIKKAYIEADKLLGEIINKLTNEKTTIFVVSDHGSGKLKYNINLNLLFLEKGLLKLKNSPLVKIKYLLFKTGLTPKKAVNIAKRFGLTKLAFFLPRGTRDAAADKFLSYQDVDFENSVCYSAGHVGQVKLIAKSEKLKVIKTIRELKNPETGECVVKKIIESKQICKGPYCEQGPDLHIVFKDYQYISYPLLMSSNKLFEKPINNYSGHHTNQGILIAAGRGVKKGRNERAAIVDIAPSILKSFGLAIPKNFDGKPTI